MTAQEPGNFAVVNGLKIYYETHGPKGKGPPLEHGRTADNDGLLRYELMAGDVRSSVSVTLWKAPQLPA